MQVTLIGIDPGVRDTGLVALRLDSDHKEFGVQHHVWSDISQIVTGTLILKQNFVRDLQKTVQLYKSAAYPTHVFIEGYRPRGNDMRQDQQMTMLVNTIHQALPKSKVLDNTGVKKVIKPDFVKLFNFRFPGTNHADLLSAARIALKGGVMDDVINEVLSDFVLDHIEERPWVKL